MTLGQGRHYLAIPGPSVMPDRVLNAMHRAAPNIYEGPLVDMVPGLLEDLKAVAATRHHAAIYIANGHGAWEAALNNIIATGDKILVLATGTFGFGWGDMAASLGAEIEVMDFGKTEGVDLEAVATRLAADKAHAIKAVLATHVDTSTSLKNDIAGTRAALDGAGHPALLCADCIASLACDRFEMDAWGVDLMVAASQKGLMTPPGLGFVYFNDRADAARDRADRVSRYWDWRPRVAPDNFYQYFAGTAPTHHLYGLREALDMLVHEEGLEAAFLRHERLARALWAAVEAWAAGGPLRLNVTDPAKRSHAVTALRIGAPHGTALRRWVSERAGVTLGIGLGMATPEDPASDGFFRIGHMGHVNAQMLMGVLGVVEAGMRAGGLPFGQGALAAAAEVVSEA